MEGNRYGGVSQKQKGLRLRHDVNPDNLRKLKDSYEIATMKGKEMRNSASTNLYVKVHGQRAGQVYAALASLLHATISLTRADGLEEFIRQTAATLPANMIDLEEWGPVLDAARESREAAAWSLLPSQPSLDEMVRKNKVFNFFFYHHPMHHFRDELKVMKSEIWRTLAGFQKDLQQCLLLLQATVAQLLRSKDIEVQQERLAVLKREIRSLETSLADTQSLLESSQDELGSAKDTIEQLEREKEDLSHTLQETKSELSAQTASREDTEKKLQGTENALQAAQVELQALRSSQETVIAGLRDELQLLQQESVLRQEAEAEIEKLKRDFAQEAIHYLAHQTSVDAAQAGLIEIAQRRMSEAEQIAEETKEDLRVALQANTDMHASLMACQSLLQNTQQISQERFDLVLKLREEVQQAHRGWTEMRTELDDLSAFSMTRLTELSLALNEAMREKQQINEGQNALLNEQKELLQQLEQEQVTLLSRQRELEQEQTVLLDQQKEICQQLEQERAVQKQLLEELQEVQREKVMCEKALQDCQLLLAEAQEVAARSRRKSVGVLTVPPLQEDEVNEASDLHVEEEKEEQNSEQVVEIVQLESDRAGNEEQKEQVVEEEVAPNLLLARDVAMKSISSGLATMPLKIVPSLETLAKRSTTASAVRDDVAQHNRSSSPRQEQQVQNAEEHQTVNEEQKEGEVEKAAVQMQSLARGFLGRQKTKRLLGEESKGEEEDKEEEGGGEREEDVVSDVLAKIVSSISSVEERVEGGEEKEQENEASPGGGADGVEVEAKTEVENAENVTEAVAMVTEEAVVTSGGESGNGDDVDHPREGSGEEAVASSAEEVVSEVVSAMVGRIESEGEAAREGNVAANMQNEGVGEAGQKEGEVEKAAVQMQSLARGFLGRQKTKRLLGEESKGEEEDKEEEGGGEREEDVVSDVLAKIVSSISSVEERVEGGEEKEQENEASPGGGGAEEVEAKAEVEVAQGKEGEKKSVSDEQAVRVQSLARGFLGRQKVRRLLTENLAVQQGILLAHGDTKQGSTGWYSTDGQLFYFCLDDKDFLLLCGPLSTLMHDQACANYRTAMGAEADKKRPVVIDRLAIQATRLQIDTLLSDLVERDAYISTLEAKVNDLQTQLSSQRLAVEEYSQALLGLDAIRNELALYKEKYKGDALHGFLEKAQLVKESHRGGLIRLTSIIRGFLARKRVKRLKLTRLADDTGVLVAMENTLQGETGWYLGPNGSIYYFVLKDVSRSLCWEHDKPCHGQWIYAAGPLSEQDFKATYLQGAKSFGRSVPSGKILTRCAFRLGTVVAPNSEVYIANGSAKLFLAVPVDVIIPELLVNGSSSQLPEASLFSAQGSSLSQMDSLLEESSSLILEGNSIPSAK
eukprot:scaffold3296_cov159-Ochromonas_danica.AAC.18